MLSIITPSYNCPQFILDAYKCVLWQTNPNWEWIIIDDGSTDNTVEVIESFAKNDSRIRFQKRDRMPKGACTCRNIGVDLSQYQFLSFLDADDVLAHFCVAQRLGQMQQNPGADFIAFQAIIFKERLDDTRLLWNVENGEEDLERTIMMNPVFGGGNTIWNKNSFVQLGKWNENLLIYQDIELDSRAFANDLRYVKRLDMPPDIYGRISSTSLSRSKGKNIARLNSKLVFCKIIYANLEKGNKVERCRTQLRWLFMKVFLEFINERENALAADLSQFAFNNKVVSKAADKIVMKIILASSKAGINTVPLIYSFTRSGNKKSTFNTQKYDGEIRTL